MVFFARRGSSMSIESVVKPAYEFAAYQSLPGEVLTERIQQVRREMGPRLLILGHHYQQDDVIALADLRGDSYGLSELAASHAECRAIVFCGVHFMAETADILANRPERLAQRGGQRIPVVLPDLEAGCPLADMADVGQVEECWAPTGGSDRHRRPDADHLRQFGGRIEGVLRAPRRHRLHQLERPGGARLGVSPPPPRAVLSRPASRAQHGRGNGNPTG